MFPLLAGLAVFVGVLAYGGIWWPVWAIGALAAVVGVMWVLVEMKRGTTVGLLLGADGYFLAATGNICGTYLVGSGLGMARTKFAVVAPAPVTHGQFGVSRNACGVGVNYSQ